MELPTTLLSVYLDTATAQAWRASVKALGLRQGQAMHEALQMWLKANKTDIEQAMGLSTQTKLTVAK